MAPSMFPQAKFDPIPPDLDLHGLVDRTPNFEWVLRISASQIRSIGPQEFEKLVLYHVIQGGRPLVIENWNDRLPKWLFSAAWLETTYDKKQESVRDITGQTDIPMTTGHYLRSMKQLTNQWTSANFRDERRQRLYLKDIDCPVEWSDWLRKVIPPNLFYMNSNVEDRGDRNEDSDREMFIGQEPRTAAPAGDLMSNLPEEMRAQNLMCYIGHEGTYTPAHREMCASLGQNIMVEASGDENGEKPGSSIWFMTESKDREVVREYFLSMLGHDVEIEKHFAQINAWKKASFPVYVVEQKVGDFILVPPLAPHQVWNRGTRTVKVAWNRTTAETLELALHEALPKARLVCRDEQYKNKAIVYYSLRNYYKKMTEAENSTSEMAKLGFGQDLLRDSPRMKQMAKEFKALFALFSEILVGEMFATKEKDVELIEFDSNITCSYCRANVFNRFLTCKHCVRILQDGGEDTYDICMDCYAMGRSCLCISNLSWCEQWSWPDLVGDYEAWRTMIIKNDGFIDLDASPMPLEIARGKSGKKAIAQICQEQLRQRPFKDITKVEWPPEPELEPEVDDEGRPAKKKKGRKEKKGDVHRCHVCCHKDYTYRLAFCSKPGCTDAYCYGVLYRAFDMMPQDVMENENWICPKCRSICNCGACRRQGFGQPYTPKNTLLGHDTRPIADDRSVESLVDFRMHNLQWLKNSGDESRSLHSKRMQKLKQAAEAEKAKETELVNEAAGLASEEADSGEAAMQPLVDVGYGDQTHILGPDHAPMVRSHVSDDTAHLQQAQDNGQPAEIADMSLDQGLSSYPDPATTGHERMLGMGYYEQDDSPDRILFHPYEAPTAETVAAASDEPEPSEYVKKLLRASKRRARQEDDNDPDFAAPRSHQRKRPRLDRSSHVDEQQEAIENMDPALFNEISVLRDPSGAEAVNADEASTTVADAAEAYEEKEQSPPRHRRHSPNRPSLRHTRPKISYAEDGDGEEEFDEVLIPRSHQPPQGIDNFDPENTNRDPLDVASAAIRGLAATGADTLKSHPTLEKRGPGRPRKSDLGLSKTAIETPTRRPRGRPARVPRTVDGYAALPQQESTAMAIDEDLELQLARELDAFDDEGNIIEKTDPTVKTNVIAARKSARSQRNRDTSLAAAAGVTIDANSTRPSANAAADPQFLSMAERMRLSGKKARIVARKSAGPSSKTKRASISAYKTAITTVGSDGNDVDYDPAAEEEPLSTSSPSPPVMEVDTPTRQPTLSPKTKPVASPTPPSMLEKSPSLAPTLLQKNKGPTIIRLGDLDSESGSDIHSYAEDGAQSPQGLVGNGDVASSSSGSDFEDIPASKTDSLTRGAAVRGRGGIRGRSRGRGRGRARRGYH